MNIEAANANIETIPNTETIRTDSWNEPAQPNLGSQLFIKKNIYPLYRMVGNRKAVNDAEIILR